MTNILCSFFDFIGNLLNTLLPNMNISGLDNISSAISYIVAFISASDYLFPVTTLFQITGIVLAYRVYLFGVWVFNWIVRTVRG